MQEYSEDGNKLIFRAVCGRRVRGRVRRSCGGKRDHKIGSRCWWMDPIEIIMLRLEVTKDSIVKRVVLSKILLAGKGTCC